MKKKFVNLGNNQLSRKQMKNIKGGMDEMLDDGANSKYYMCCWTNDLTNCSGCVKGGTSCVTGATLKECI
jgi:hypothetical protein